MLLVDMARRTRNATGQARVLTGITRVASQVNVTNRQDRQMSVPKRERSPPDLSDARAHVMPSRAMEGADVFALRGNAWPKL